MWSLAFNGLHVMLSQHVLRLLYYSSTATAAIPHVYLNFCCVFVYLMFPGTKLAQAAIFNNPSNACKVLVATDAIGMGLNL